MMEVIHAKMKTARVGVKLSLVLGGQNDINSGGRLLLLGKMAKNRIHIRGRKDRGAIDRDKVGTLVSITEALQGKAGRRMPNVREEGPLHTITFRNREAKGGVTHRSVGKGDSVEGSERRIGGFNLWKVEVEVENRRRDEAVTKKHGIGGLDLKVIHSLIESNTLTDFDSLGLKVVVQDVLHGLSKTEKDAFTSMEKRLVELRVGGKR